MKTYVAVLSRKDESKTNPGARPAGPAGPAVPARRPQNAPWRAVAWFAVVCCVAGFVMGVFFSLTSVMARRC